MSLFFTRKVDFQYNDARGSLTQLIHEGFKQVNVLETKKGVERGTHYHKQCIEAFYLVSGSVEVSLWDDTNSETVVFKKGDFFEIHPFVFHRMYFLEDSTMIQMYSIPVENDDGEKDIYTEDCFNA